MKITSAVVATTKITELGLMKAGRTHVHARPGERGEVVDALGDDWFMVRWGRTGTVAQCDASEIRAVA